MAYLASLIGKAADADYYKQKQLELKNAINEHCYDEKDGMYHICDTSVLYTPPCTIFGTWRKNFKSTPLFYKTQLF